MNKILYDIFIKIILILIKTSSVCSWNTMQSIKYWITCAKGLFNGYEE